MKPLICRFGPTRIAVSTGAALVVAATIASDNCSNAERALSDIAPQFKHDRNGLMAGFRRARYRQTRDHADGAR